MDQALELIDIAFGTLCTTKPRGCIVEISSCGVCPTRTNMIKRILFLTDTTFVFVGFMEMRDWVMKAEGLGSF